MADTGQAALPQLLQGRIPAATFRIVTLVTFSLALFAATCRLVALIPQRKKIGLDDVFLIFATIFLIVGTTILLIQLDTLYFIESIELNGLPVGPDAEGLTDKVDRFQKFKWSFLAISWSSILFVKFSFLAFFAGLCDRMPKIDLYRKALYGLCIVTFIYLVLNGIVTCPHDGPETLQCTDTGALQRNLAMGIVAISMDILTDLTILSIPGILLWKVKLKPYQKLVIGVALSLSIVMVVLAIIRMIGFGYYGVIDNSWIYLWQHVEASAAVTMISLAAFRTVFTARASRHRPWSAPVPNFVRIARPASSSDQHFRLDEMFDTDTTMSGVCTIIEHGPVKDDVDYVEQPGIAVARDFTIYEEEAIRQPKQALL